MGGLGVRWVDPSLTVLDGGRGSSGSSQVGEDEVTLSFPVPVDLLVSVDEVGTVVPTAERLRAAFFLADEVVVDMMIRSICDARLSDESLRRSSGRLAVAALSPVAVFATDAEDDDETGG